MIPVEQPITENNEDLSFSACLASILEVPLSHIPPIPFSDKQTDYLYSKGFCLLRVPANTTTPHTITTYTLPRYGLYIMSCKTKRNSKDKHTLPDQSSPIKSHSVICHAGMVLYDPHPMRHIGTGNPIEYIFLIPINYHQK